MNTGWNILIFCRLESEIFLLFLGPLYMEGGVPSSIVFPSFVSMPGRVTLLGGLTFYHVKGRDRVKFSTIGLLSHSRHLKAWFLMVMLVSNPWNNIPHPKGELFLTLLQG